MKLIILFLFAAVVAQSTPYLCALKSKTAKAAVAPVLRYQKAQVDGILDKYLVQTMLADNPMTVLGLDTRKLDYRKPYVLDFVVNDGARSAVLKVKFSKNTGLVVQVYNEVSEKYFSYEFMESSSGAPSISVKHENGWSSTVSCSSN